MLPSASTLPVASSNTVSPGFAFGVVVVSAATGRTLAALTDTVSTIASLPGAAMTAIQTFPLEDISVAEVSGSVGDTVNGPEMRHVQVLKSAIPIQPSVVNPESKLTVTLFRPVSPPKLYRA